MRIKRFLATAAICFGVPAAAQAAPITYEGTMALGAPVTGLVGGNSWEAEDAAGVDFWRFNGSANQLVNVRGTRLNANLDPAFTLYFGTTTADAAQFIHDADWGGLTFLRIADDEVSVLSGPGGDPLLANFRLPFAGAYTVAIGGFNSNGAGPFSYSLQVSAAAVPITNTASLIGIGFIALWYSRRRRGSAFERQAS